MPSGAYSLWVSYPLGSIPSTAHPVMVAVAPGATTEAQLGLAPTHPFPFSHFLPLLRQPQ